jgi:glucokinase
MVANGAAEDGIGAVFSAIDLLFADYAKIAGNDVRDLVTGIGVCAPGPLDPNMGVVINPPNLPCWRDYPLATEVQEKYGVPVKIENDANAAALAEAYWGAGRGFRHIFYAGLGTGIGTGIVCDGRIYNGRTGAAAEGGHMSIDYRGPRCGCGKPGCIEILAAGPAIAKRAREKLAGSDYPQSIILNLLRDQAPGGGSVENLEFVTSEMVGHAFAAGDPLAKAVLGETVDLLALWLSNIIDLMEPDAVVIGGGVAAMLAPLFGDLAAGIEKHCINSRSQEIPLLKAHFGEGSGIAGAAALCLESASPLTGE